MVNIQKAAIIGCGFVGASSAVQFTSERDFFRTGTESMRIKKKQKGRQWTSAMVDHMHTR